MGTYHSNLVLEDALADDQRTVEVRLLERGLANEMAEWLAEQGAHDVTVVRERGIVAFGLEYLVAAIVNLLSGNLHK